MSAAFTWASALPSSSRYLEILRNACGICLELLDKNPTTITVITIINAEESLDVLESTLKKLQHELAIVDSGNLGEIEALAILFIQVLAELLVWLEKATYDLSDLQIKAQHNLNLFNVILSEVKNRIYLENTDVESLSNAVILEESDDTQSLTDTVILDDTDDWSSQKSEQ